MEWLNDYITLLDQVDPKTLQISAAISLKNEHLPSTIYKYYRPSDHALENLRTGAVWLSKPSAYNDPFEFAELIDFSKLQAPINSDAQFDVVGHFDANYPLPDEIQAVSRQSADPMEVIIDYVMQKEGRTAEQTVTFKKVMKEVSQKYHGEIQQSKIEFMQDQMKVCSFCETNDQLLMWGHYAANHTGFCVAYDLTKWPADDLRKRMLYPVIYQSDRYDSTPHLLQSLNKKEGFNPLYAIISGSTKSAEWAYEKEWRFIINLGDPFPEQNYRMDCQSAVFLGMRMAPAVKTAMIAVCNQQSLPVYQAGPAKDKYELKFELIK